MAVTPRAGVDGMQERVLAGPMSHARILRALSGLYLGFFVATLASTIVTNALPVIVVDLHSGQSTYTWVISANLLATAVSSPIWGKLADLTSKKALMQLGLLVFAIGSVLCGLAPSAGTLIAARVVQGIGAGGLITLAQVIMATIIAPRQRGRYSGYMGAVVAVATSAGPLLGGLIVGMSWLGWRWCFIIVVPFTVAAMVVLHKSLNLPVHRREVKVDWAGATLITGATSLLLIWVTFAGTEYGWLSWQTAVMVGGGVALALLFIFAETKASEPIVPLWLFRHRTVVLAVSCSSLAGIALYAGTIFLSQYFQLSRGQSPTMAGLLCLPQILGMALASTVSGRVITATGRWKPILIAGGVLIMVGVGLLGLVRHSTPYWETAVSMACVGVGLGMTMQNLVLSVQNQVPLTELGAASTVVSFFRTLGGTIGVSALGAILAARVSRYAAPGLNRLGVHGAAGGSSIPALSALPVPVRSVVEDAFGHAIGDLFLFAAPFAVLCVIGILYIKEAPLRTSSALQAHGHE
jgi:EmrB/QacA subfamily drug resistance transporter